MTNTEQKRIEKILDLAWNLDGQLVRDLDGDDFEALENLGVWDDMVDEDDPTAPATVTEIIKFYLAAN